MQFTVEIGRKEKSRIEIYRDWFAGSFRILANGKVVAKRSAWSPLTHFSLPNAVHRFEFPVGQLERYNVVVEHERPAVLAGIRPHTYRVFVDGQLVHEEIGY